MSGLSGGSFTVIDHTEKRWQARYRTHGRENGAATYSRDIVEHHVPLWAEKFSDKNVVLSSCPKMLDMGVSGDVAVQYLHEYKYDNPINSVQVIHKELKYLFGRVIFVTAYRSLHHQIKAAGFESVFVPMAIDTNKVVPANRMEPRGPRSVAWYGNILGPKAAMYKSLSKTLTEHGWALEQVKGPQFDTWQELTRYEYGVGVGRCAQEMMHIGLKVMIAGVEFGGLVTNDSEWLIQRDTNFNGRVVTFDRDPVACIGAWDSSISHRAYSVQDAVRGLEQSLAALGA